MPGNFSTGGEIFSVGRDLSGLGRLARDFSEARKYFINVRSFLGKNSSPGCGDRRSPARYPSLIYEHQITVERTCCQPIWSELIPQKFVARQVPFSLFKRKHVEHRHCASNITSLRFSHINSEIASRKNAGNGRRFHNGGQFQRHVVDMTSLFVWKNFRNSGRESKIHQT